MRTRIVPNGFHYRVAEPGKLKRKGITIRKTLLLAIIAGLLGFAVSYYLLSYYTGGDQVAYHAFYESVFGAPLSDLMHMGVSYLTSREPLSLFVLWAGSNLGIEKNIYISALNTILIVGLVLLVRRHGVRLLVIGLLLTNFYVIVLMTGTERLKIAYIILVYAALIEGRLRIVGLVLSPFAHLQSLLLMPSLLLAAMEGQIRRLLTRGLLSRDFVRYGFLVVFLAIMVLTPLWDGVMRKGGGYVDSQSESTESTLFELVNLFLVSVIALYVTKNRFRMCLVLLPMYPAVALLGGSRVNMIAVTLVFYNLMLERRLNHLLVLVLMVYFTWKAMGFIERIIVYGNGFALVS